MFFTSEYLCDDSIRYSLKIHYVVYPKCLKYYGKFAAWATTKYDIIARYLFLSTLRPETLIQKALSRFILLCTHFTFGVVQYGGGGMYEVFNIIHAYSLYSL
jgi:hypothetical protein